MSEIVHMMTRGFCHDIKYLIMLFAAVQYNAIISSVSQLTCTVKCLYILCISAYIDGKMSLHIIVSLLTSMVECLYNLSLHQL